MLRGTSDIFQGAVAVEHISASMHMNTLCCKCEGRSFLMQGPGQIEKTRDIPSRQGRQGTWLGAPHAVMPRPLGSCWCDTRAP